MTSVSYDSELQRFNDVLRRRYGIRPGDHVLDVGCGAGQTTRDAARLAGAGSVMGIDVSAPMIERARRAAAEEDLHNITFAHGDAARQALPAARFDVVISRFGTMFFADPIAAFTHLARATLPHGRLVMLVWQARDRNAWATAIQQALAVDAPAGGPDAFSLGDPPTVTQILVAAGFGEVALEDVHEPVYYGPDLAAAIAWVSGFSTVSDVLRRLDPASADAARARLEHMLARHARVDGVWLDARAWLVTARRAS